MFNLFRIFTKGRKKKEEKEREMGKREKRKTGPRS